MLNTRRVFIAFAFAGLVFCTFAKDKSQHKKDHHQQQHHHHDCLDNSSPECNEDEFKQFEVDDIVETDLQPGQPDWCQFNNGTKIPYGLKFLHTACTICECTKSRQIRCSMLQCLPSYCVDDSMPTRFEGQCCAQCKYEQPGTPCFYQNLSFPHGVVVRSVEHKMQCWCQMGQIECRTYIGTMLENLSLFAGGAIIYIIFLIIAAFFVFGLLICCGITLFIYNHYQKNQNEFQEAYDQYVNEAGWQPVEETEQTEGDDEILDKETEAFQGQQTEDYVRSDAAPPYSPPKKS